MGLPSVMQHRFSEIPAPQIPRSKFNRSCGHKTSFNAGYLIPIFCDLAFPGDTFSLKEHMFARLSTLVKPLMDNLWLDTMWFAVNLRLLWNDPAGGGSFKKFMGEKINPTDSTDYTIPILDAYGTFDSQTIYDYFGLPTDPAGHGNSQQMIISALPFRAYNMIWNEWFRDENLQPSVPIQLGDGPDDLSNYTLLKRGKRHDYFTSCLPWPQKGDPVTMPLGNTAPVWGDGNTLTMYGGSQQFGTIVDDVSLGSQYVLATAMDVAGQAVGTPSDEAGNPSTNQAVGVVMKDNGEVTSSGLYADLSEAVAPSINAIREAFQMQKMLEKDARGGTRFPEMLQQHFGVQNPDSRMQRPEYLGGGSVRININPVQQTGVPATTDTENTPLGNLAAYSHVNQSNGVFHRSFTEHCYVIGLCNVRADITYSQGLDRIWSYQHRDEFYFPSLAYLGEQPVYYREIYCLGNLPVPSTPGIPDDSQVFGYQERWAELRYKRSMITGKQRPTDTDNLSIWNLSQKFSTYPPLGAEFIADWTDGVLQQKVAVNLADAPQIIADFFFELNCARCMPVYSVPGLVDHF